MQHITTTESNVPTAFPVHARCKRCKQIVNAWRSTHMSDARCPGNPLCGRCLCVLPPPPAGSQMQRCEGRKSWSPHACGGASVGLKSPPSPCSLALANSHAHTHTHTHTHTHSRAQTQSYSVLNISRSPAAGVWRQGAPLSVMDPPPPSSSCLLRLWPPLLEKAWSWGASRQQCLSAPASTPRHTIPQMRLHLLWHHDFTLYLPFFSSASDWRTIPPPPSLPLIQFQSCIHILSGEAAFQVYF